MQSLSSLYSVKNIHLPTVSFSASYLNFELRLTANLTILLHPLYTHSLSSDHAIFITLSLSFPIIFILLSFLFHYDFHSLIIHYYQFVFSYHFCSPIFFVPYNFHSSFFVLLSFVFPYNFFPPIIFVQLLFPTFSFPNNFCSPTILVPYHFHSTIIFTLLSFVFNYDCFQLSLLFPIIFIPL